MLIFNLKTDLSSISSTIRSLGKNVRVIDDKLASCTKEANCFNVIKFAALLSLFHYYGESTSKLEKSLWLTENGKCSSKCFKAFHEHEYLALEGCQPFSCTMVLFSAAHQGSCRLTNKDMHTTTKLVQCV